MFNNNSAQILAHNNPKYQKRLSSQQDVQTNQPQISNNNLFQQNQQSQGQSQQKQYRQYLQEQEVLKTISEIAELANNEEVNKFITVLDKALEQTDAIMRKASKETEATTKQVATDQVQNQIKKKYFQIKERNLQILKAMLDLRKRLMNYMFMQKASVPAKELELQTITEKIGLISTHIRQKLEKYHFSKQINSQTHKKAGKVTSINAPLVELRQASEKICKQTIKLRQQLKLCLRILGQWTQQFNDKT